MSDSIGTVDQSDQQAIIFNEIPATLRDPRVVQEIRPTYSNTGLLRLPSKAIIISQMLPAGKATPGQVYPITGPGQAEALFGQGSMATIMVNAWLANNTTTPLFAVALADPVGATAASVDVLIGAATFAGGFGVTAQIAGQQVPIAIPGGSAAADLANALIAAVNATPALPVTAALAAGSTVNVVLTAKNEGLCGNEISVNFIDRTDASAPVVSISVGTAGVLSGNLAGGVGTPLVQPVLTTISGTWYTDIVMPWTDSTNKGALSAELVRRYGALVNLDARGYIGINGSYATVSSFGDAGNCIQLVTVGVRGEVEPCWQWAAAWGAIHAFRLANDPSRQSKGIAVVGLTAPSDSNQWLPAERDLLLNNGISTWTALNDGTVVISRTITGYLQSTSGVADAAWLDVMTPATMTAIRYDFTNYVKLVYPTSKLFDDGSLGAEYDGTAVTPKRLKGSWAKRCLDYETSGWIEGSASTVQKGYAVRNASDKNRLDWQFAVRIAGNFMIGAGVLEFEA